MKKLFLLIALMLLPATFAQAQEKAVPQSRADIQLSFAPLVKQTSPAVVNIYAKRIVRERLRTISPFMNDPFFGQFFGQGFGQGFGGGAVQERIENSLGSGVIVDPSGQIATNTHVIKGALEITVVLADGREFDAEKVLVDEKTDMAILRIDPKGEKLSYLALADSDAIEVGDLVLAIGNPFGVGQTVTSGIVSATARTGMGALDYRYFIQTDAAINPGNSGGALIDMNGRLIGINSMIFTRDGGSLGLGFAIPANMVATVIDASKRGDKLVRPWTGLSGQSVTSDMMVSLGLNRARGALINRVHPNGPGAKAGIKVGDVILSINGHDIQDPEALKFRLATVPIDGDVLMAVSRGGKSFEAKMKAEAAPEVPPRETYAVDGRTPLTGATFANISPAVADEIGLDHPDAEGVVVMAVADGTPAARMGLRTGDILLKLNGADIPAMRQLKEALGASKNIRRWMVQVQRGSKVMNLMVAL